MIEQEKKRKQRVVKYTPAIKKQRWSEGGNVFIQAGSSKRQKTKGQDGKMAAHS